MAPEGRRGGADGPLRVGLVGCGNISAIYLGNAQRFAAFDIVAVADIDPERARVRGEEFGVPALPVPDLLSDPRVELILNLTFPTVHAAVSGQALEAGKHVYSEKPLATDRRDGERLLAEANSRGLRIGCAPDTFLGGGLQAARQAVDMGRIGRPVAATAFMMSAGVEMWHPDPDFFFRPGAGPLFDMGPYYLTALISLMGPVRAVTGSAATSYPERLITSKPRAGERIRVETPTHITSQLEFESGAVATLITSFDVQASQLPRMEIYGSEGTLSLPDPNTFGGPLRLCQKGTREWQDLPPANEYVTNSRGLGLADMARSLRAGSRPRASGDVAFHVLDVMQTTLESAGHSRRLEVGSTCTPPDPLDLVEAL